MNTYLYRLWTKDDELLYIGISKNAIARLYQHLEGKPWADQIHKQTVEKYVDRDAAAYAEKLAIQTEAPLHNVVYNKTQEQTASDRASEQWAEATVEDRAKALVGLQSILEALPATGSKQDKRIRDSIAMIVSTSDTRSDKFNFGAWNE